MTRWNYLAVIEAVFAVIVDHLLQRVVYLNRKSYVLRVYGSCLIEYKVRYPLYS